MVICGSTRPTRPRPSRNSCCCRAGNGPERPTQRTDATARAGRQPGGTGSASRVNAGCADGAGQRPATPHAAVAAVLLNKPQRAADVHPPAALLEGPPPVPAAASRATTSTSPILPLAQLVQSLQESLLNRAGKVNRPRMFRNREGRRSRPMPLRRRSCACARWRSANLLAA